MAKIIDLKKRFENIPDNLITLKPWEFRRADWESSSFIQMLKSLSEKLEDNKRDVYKNGGKRISTLPSHFILKGGMENTIRGLYKYRENKEKMIEVYYLTGLIDCMINQVNPLLRTDLISDIYKKVNTLKSILGISWYGKVDQVLFPIDIQFYNHLEYKARLAETKTLKEMYSLIRIGTRKMFDILSSEYMFYIPGRRV
jgi:hypothetical protein